MQFKIFATDQLVREENAAQSTRTRTCVNCIVIYILRCCYENNEKDTFFSFAYKRFASIFIPTLFVREVRKYLQKIDSTL